MSNFERGLQNALKTTWSESMVNGCRFHFENAITKQLAILGLQREYRHQIQVKKWARKVSALCLLPANKFLVAWGSRVIEIAQLSREIKIKLFAFKKSLNRRLKSNIGDRHRGFLQFMKLLNQHVIVHTIQELQQLACNQPVRRDQRDYGAIEKMRCFEKKLRDGVWTTERFLSTASYLFQNFKVVALDENSMNEVGESLPLPTSTSTESPKCVVCTVNERNALVMPCRHFLFCQHCIQQVQKSNTAHCPTCRGPISPIIEPFQRFSKIFPFTYIFKTRMSHN
nr:uncharacterized protein LOC124808546 [Hydra vulgaris]